MEWENYTESFSTKTLFGTKKEEYVPHIPTVEKLQQYLQPLYVIEDYMDSEEHYVELKESIYRLVKGCIEHKECREALVKFKFYHKDAITHHLQLRHFAVELFLLYPLVFLPDISDVMDESFIPNFFHDMPKIDNFINFKLIDTLRDNDVKNTVRNESISNVTYDLKRISKDFALIMGLNFSTETFLDLYKNNEEIRDIMETKFPEGMQSKDVEDLMAEKQKRLISLIKDIKDNDLGIVLRSGTGIKHKQLSEFMIAQTTKPDIDGNVIPVTINNSTLIGGLDRPSYIYTDASGTRKSLILNKKVMGKAGYYGKKVLLLALTLQLSTTVFDCGTKHLVPYKIYNKEMLLKLNNKYYRETKDPGEPLKLLDAKNDTHLIGKWIYVRSIATCALGDKMCHCCVGRTALLNLDIASGFAGFESEEITKEVNQNILSSKHLLTTDSERIEFNDEFEKFFQLSSDEIYPYINDNPYLENAEDWAVYIDLDRIERDDDFDSDTEYSTYIRNGSFEMVNVKTNERVWIRPKEEKELYITPDAVSMLYRKRGYIQFKDIMKDYGEDFKIFNLIVVNNELTKPLYEIMNLTGKEKKTGEEETIESMCQKMVDLCIDSKIGASAVACEVIVNRLIRALNDDGTVGMERPDFTSYRIPSYKIQTIDKCLEHNRSPFVGFASANLKRQLLSDELVEEKWEPGYLAALFKTMVEYHADGVY